MNQTILPVAPDGKDDDEYKRQYKKAGCNLIYDLLESMPYVEAPLDHIKHEIALFVCQPFLPSILDNFVEYKYFKYCQQLLQEEIEHSTALIEMSSTELRDTANQIFCSRKLDDLPSIVTSLRYYQLISKESRLLSHTDNIAILRRVQVDVAMQINSFTSIGDKGNAIATCLQLSKDVLLSVQSIIDKEYTWKNYIEANPTFPAAQYESIVRGLRRQVDDCVEREIGTHNALLRETMSRNVVQLVEYISQSVKINAETKHGKRILIVKAPVILTRAVIPEISSALTADRKVEEVHLVASEVVYIDCNLQQDQWHGKNILVIGKKVEVIIPDLVWDLSGDLGQSANSSRATDGTCDSMDGQNGEDGTPGESGGYCTFIAGVFENMKRMTIKMNGGNGGRGQNGGNGKNGRDGKNGAQMSLSTLLEKLDSSAKNTGKTGAAVRHKTLLNLKNMINHYEERNSSGMDLDKGTRVSVGMFTEAHCLIKGHTEDGMLIEFGAYEADSPIYLTRHAYCLVRGAVGTAGELGGFGGNKGAGGKGGYGGGFASFKLSTGSVESCGIRCENKNGDDGENGQDGMDGSNGRCGKNGGDVGYVDNMWWGEAQTYGPNGTFELVNYSTSQETSAWCEYYKKHRAIRSTTRDPPQPLQNNRQRKNKVTEKVAASRKDKIDHTDALNDYAAEVLAKYTIGTSMDELEFHQTLKEVIGKTREVIQSEIKKDSWKEKKVKICRPAPHTRMHKQCNGQQSRPHQLESTDKILSDSKGNIKLFLKRFEAYEGIRSKVESSWKNQEKTKIEHVKQPTSERGYASALHALFGNVNSLGFYETSKTKREEVCDNLMKHVDSLMEDQDAQNNLKESLYAYFNESSKFDESFTQQNRYNKLDKYDKVFQADPTAFPWSDVMNDKKAIQEYISFLKEPTVQFLISDVRLIAFVYGLATEIFMSYDGSSIHVPMEQHISTTNRSEEKAIIRIAVNQQHEFSRMDPVKTIDWSEMHQQINMVVQEVYSCESNKKIKKYMEREHFEVSSWTKKKDLKIFPNEITKLQIVRDLSLFLSSASLKEEKLVVETALQMWPDLIVKILYERVLTSTIAQMKTSCKRMFSKVTNAILSGKENEEDLAPYLWIICTHSPEKWTVELALNSFQQHFEGVKRVDILIWRKMLSSFPSELVHYIGKLVECEDVDFDKNNKANFIEFIKSIRQFHLNDDMDFSKLDGIHRTHWPFQLRKLYLSSRLQKLPNICWNDSTNKQTQALYYLHALYNEKSTEVNYLLEQLDTKLASKSEAFIGITLIFEKFYGGFWSLTQENVKILESVSLEEWMVIVTKQSYSGIGKARSIQTIQKLIEDDSNSTLLPESLSDIVQLARHMDNIKMPEKFLSDFKVGMHEWLKSFKMRIKDTHKTSWLQLYVEAVAHVDFVVQIELGYGLRSTQKLTILSALYEGSMKRSNLLAQIATGEGKTCIVLAVAICRAIFGEKTDVVTSSGILAQRDATVYKHIYSAFDVTVGEVTSENSEDRRKAYLCTVVYGEASHFERDYLLDRFYNQNIRGSRPFGDVIVDEVDSMFLDKGNSVLYLSHQPPDLDSLEGLFVFIWANVVQLVNSGSYHPLTIHELVLQAMYPSVSVDDLLLFLSEKDVQDLWDWLLEKKIINSSGRLLQNTASLPRDIPNRFSNSEKQLRHVLQSKLDRSGSLPVFNYLKPFVELHLFSWICSAFQATQLTEGREYVVDVDHTKTTLDKNPRIMILDLDTGVDMKESQWNEALHQFLQLKHGCRLSSMNLKAVFISNITFFNKYNRIFGLTGTIGTESDRQFLKQTYNVHVLCVPLAQPKQFIEQEPIICKDISNWKTEICQDVKDKMQCGRSVLVVCGTVHEAEVLFAHLKLDTDASVELYRRDYEQFKATENGQCLPPRQVIVATNLSGRGTDIKLNTDLRANGGLHVVLSYLPDNLRVEQQAFGRAARCGDQGTGRLIFIGRDKGDAIDMKIERDELEINRVSDIQNHYSSVILKEEEMFKTFQQSFDELTGALEKAYKYVNDFHNKTGENEDSTRGIVNRHFCQMKELVMYSMLDDWAYWLDRYSIILTKKEQSTLLDKGLYSFDLDYEKNMQDFITMTGKYELVKSKYEEPNWLKSSWDWCKSTLNMRGDAGAVEAYALSLIHEPALLVKVAKVNIDRGELETAEGYLNKVLKNEPESGKVAKYYKLLCMIKRKTWKDSREFETLKNQVLEALDDWRCRQSSYASAVAQIQSVNNRQILHGEGYKCQKESVIRIIGVYMQSMQNVTGNNSIETSDYSALCGNDVGEHLLKYLVSQGAVLETCFVTQLTDEQIKKLAITFGMDDSRLKTVLSYFLGRFVTPETGKALEQKLKLPSRRGFWNEIMDCLESVKEFAIIQTQTTIVRENKRQKELSAKCEQNEFIAWAKLHSNKTAMVSKYGIDMSETTDAQMVLMGDKVSFETQQKFRLLRKSGKLCYDQVGIIHIEKLIDHKLKSYFRIEQNAFEMIDGIDSNESSEIFNILKESRIVNANGVLLTTEWQKDKLNLTKKWEVYRADILAIVHSKCRYKYEILSMVYQYEMIQKSDSESRNLLPSKITISLPSRPHKDFIIACLELGAIRGRVTGKSYFAQDGVSKFLNVFREPLSWAKWVGEKTSLIDEEKAKLSTSDLCRIFSEQNNHNLMGELYQELQAKEWIKADGEIILDLGKTTNYHLSPKFEYYEPELLPLVQYKQEMVKKDFLKEALKISYECQGKLNTLENPDANLVDIVTQLTGKESQVSKNATTVELREELEMLTLSGFDDVIDTVERTYTMKMILGAIAIIIIGLAQIALGLYIEFLSMGFGTFVASGLVSEGIGDVIYGIMAFRSGQFSWQDWVDHKWRSIAITAATIGIAAVFAKGIKYSKFGEKLFGSFGTMKSGRAIQEALKKGAESGVKRSILPVVLKSFGYKVLHGCAIAAGSMAVSYAYDKALKKFVENVSSHIFSNTHKAVNDHEISNTLSQLCDQCGISKAQEILNRCSSQVLKDTSSLDADAQQYLSKIFGTISSGIRDATDKMNRAGTFTQDESVVLFSLLKILNGLLTTASVLDAMIKMNESVKQYISQINNKLKREMELANQQADMKPTKSEKEDFVLRFKVQTNDVMKQKIGAIMQHTIIEPLMNLGCQKLLQGIGRAVRGKYREYKEGIILEKIDDIKSKLDDEANSSEEVKRGLHKQLLQLCSKSRNPKVIAHAIEFGGPLGAESLQALADMLGVTIVVNSNNPNMPSIFEPQNGSGNGKTLHLKHTISSNDPADLGHWESDSGTSSDKPSSNTPDCLLDAINQELNHHCGDGQQIDRKSLANFMRTDENFKNFVHNGWHHSFNAIGAFGGAQKLKKCNKAEVDGDEKEEIKSRLDSVENQLKSENKMKTSKEESGINPKDNLGPIKEFATENVNGKERSYYVSGTITKDTINERQQRRKDDRADVMADGCTTHDNAGHLSSVASGSPTASFNLFTQNSAINNSVNKSVENTATSFVKKSPERNTVDFKVMLDGRGGNGRAHNLIHHYIYKTDGKVVNERVFKVKNPACACPPPERRRNRGPG